MSRDLVELFFNDKPAELSLYNAIEEMIKSIAPVSVEVMKSQISFGTKTKFAWVWLPLPGSRRPVDSVILTFALERKVEDELIVEAVEPYPKRWTHHVIIADEADLNDKVRSWLEEACEFSQNRGRRHK